MKYNGASYAKQLWIHNEWKFSIKPPTAERIDSEACFAYIY